MATIADIVRETGLARTTVAEILRGKPGYNDQTRKRVQTVARRLKYRPNFLSKALSGGRSMTIGVLAASLETEFVNHRLIAVEAAAREAGYLAYVTGWGDNDGNGMATYLQDLIDRRVDGLIIHREIPFDKKIERMLAKLEIPVVYLDTPPTPEHTAVELTRDEAVKQLADHLALLGHRSAAFVITHYHFTNQQRRADVLKCEFERVGIALEPLEDWLLPAGHYDARRAAKEYAELLRGKRKIPTVLLATNDSFAIAGIHALRGMGLSVPEDVSVVGFDDFPFSSLIDPPLTTVRQPGEIVGHEAFALLAHLMNRPDEPVSNKRLSSELVVRQSTGPARRRKEGK